MQLFRVKHKLLAASYKHASKGHDLQSLFAKFDSNGDGVLESDEMHRGLEKLLGKIEESEFKTLMQQLDSDGNGTVDLDEFVTFVTALEGNQKLKRSELEEALLAEHGELPSWQAQAKLEDEVHTKKGNTTVQQSEHAAFHLTSLKEDDDR
jgi:calcium-binding protein CML